MIIYDNIMSCIPLVQLSPVSSAFLPVTSFSQGTHRGETLLLITRASLSTPSGSSRHSKVLNQKEHFLLVMATNQKQYCPS